MREIIENRVIAGIPIEITRKSVKRMNIRIRMKDGSVAMSVPRCVADADVEHFVMEKRDWILKSQAKAQQRAAEYPDPQTKADKERLRADLNRRIAQRLPVLEQQTGLRCNGWTVRDMHTRWGSCNTKTHHINLSLMLAQRSDEELDYVIIHELVHTKVDNHGPEFYNYMDILMPNWKKIRKSLR